jgi:hypothetical protein
MIHLNFSIKRKFNSNYLVNGKVIIKREFSKFFFKKNGKLYSSLIPRFFKKFSIKNKESNLKFNKILERLWNNKIKKPIEPIKKKKKRKKIANFIN